MKRKTYKVSNAAIKDSDYSWIIAACCCFINMVMGGLLRLSGILFVATLTKFNVSRRQAAFPYSLGSTMRNLSGPVVGVLCQKLSIRMVIICGCVLSAVGIGSCCMAENILSVIISWGIFFGLGFGLSINLLPLVINQYFDKHRASASGVSFSGVCLGSFLLPPLVEIVIENFGLSGTFLIIAGLVLNCIPVAMLLKSPSPVTCHVTTKNRGKSFKRVDSYVKNERHIYSIPVSCKNLHYGVDDAHVSHSSRCCHEELCYSENAISCTCYCNALKVDHRTKNEIYTNTDVLILESKRIPFVFDPHSVKPDGEFDYDIQHPSHLKYIADNNTKCIIKNMPPSNSRICYIAHLDVQRELLSRQNLNAINWCVSSEAVENNLCSNTKRYDNLSNGKEDANKTDEFPNGIKNHFVNCDIFTPETTFLSTNQSSESIIRFHIGQCGIENANSAMCSPLEIDKNNDKIKPLTDRSKLNHREEKTSIMKSLRIFTNPMFVLLSVSVALFGFSMVCVLTIIIDFATDIGIEGWKAKYVLMSFSVTDIIGRLGLGWITDRGYMTKSGYTALLFLLQGITLISITWASSFVMLTLMMTVYGIFEGGLIILFPLLVAQYIDEELQSMAIPSSNILTGPLCITIPLLIDFFRDEMGSYSGIFYIIGAASLLCGVSWLFVSRKSISLKT